jgi:outer membrane biosynthesis protein TonB
VEKGKVRQFVEKVDKTLVASVALHVFALGWCIFSFAPPRLEAAPVDSVAVDVISADQLSKIMAGIKSGEKDKPKPLVEKVADAKPVDDPVGKIDKHEIVTSTAPDPTPPPPKPVEKKPDPPKPVVEKPKDEPQKTEKAEKKEEPKVDPIAEALKKDNAKKPTPKQEVKAAPPVPVPPKPKERVFDVTKIASLIDKRDPTREAVTGATLNSTASLGMHAGTSNVNAASWKAAFSGAVKRCFNFSYNGQDMDQFEVDVDIQLRRDGSVASEPVIAGIRGPSRSIGTAMADNAKRAVLQCQIYSFLPQDQYDSWKTIPMTFTLRDQ